MSKHVVRLMLGLLVTTLAISVHPIQMYAEGTQESEEAREIPTPVVSGAFYDAVQGIDARLEISETSSGVQLTLDTGDVIPDDPTILNYFWSIVQILNTDAAKEYDSLTFFLIGKQTLESISISSFNGIHDFTSVFLGPLSNDESVKSMVKACYWVTFGGHDISVQTSLDLINLGIGEASSLPDTAQAGYLWAMSNFPLWTNCSTEDSLITITMVADDTYEGGKETFAIVSNAMNDYTNYILAEPLLVPYKAMKIIVNDRRDPSNTLWDLAMLNTDGSWTTITNNASGEFLSGLAAD